MDAPDLAIAVEHVAVFVLPRAGDPGGVGAAQDQHLDQSKLKVTI